MKNELNVSGPKYLPNVRYLGVMPYVIVADKAFPLCPTIMRSVPREKNAARMPRPQQVFNYHFSRAKRIVEKYLWYPSSMLLHLQYQDVA